MPATDPIRVMIVDDSLVVRRLVEDSLREVTGIQVVGTASNGRIALDKFGSLAPDVVTLDVEMPELDGLATLSQIKRAHPRTHVIMFSSLTGPSAAATVEALSKGASDYVQKPSGTGGMTATRERIRAELVPKIRSICNRETQPLRVLAHQRPPAVAPTAAPSTSFSLLAIGVSTGGPAALDTLLSSLPALPVPILIVQHMPASFTGLLAKRLAAACPAMKVAEARAGVKPVAGEVWLAPGDQHLAVTTRGGHLVLDVNQEQEEGSCRPAVDVLFRSVAKHVGKSALGLVLTGMGQDGLRGSTDLRSAGATVWVQDAASSVVWGMPGAVSRAGLAHRTLPLDELAPELCRAFGTTPGPRGRV